MVIFDHASASSGAVASKAYDIGDVRWLDQRVFRKAPWIMGFGLLLLAVVAVGQLFGLR